MLDNSDITTTTKQPKGRPKRPSATTEIIRLKVKHPEMSLRDIGKVVDRDHVTVLQTLQRYNINTKCLKGYKAYRPDILAGIQHNILSSIDQNNLNKATLKDKALAFGIIYDKERLERGQATSITAFADLLGLLDKQEREKAKQQANNQANNNDDRERDSIPDQPKQLQTVDSSAESPDNQP